MVVTHLFQVLAFTAMEPPTVAGAGGDQRGEAQGLPLDAADRPARRRPGAVRRLPRHRRRGPRLRDRDLHRAQVLRRQLALGRRAVLPAHRQAAGRGRADHLDRVQGAAALDVPARVGRRRPRPRPPDLRPRRQGEDVAVVLRQAPGSGHEARQAVDAVRDAGHRLGGLGAGGVRAAHLRRRARRPHAVHRPPRASSGSGRSPSRCWRTRRSSGPTGRARGVPTRSTSWWRRSPGGSRSSGSGATRTPRAETRAEYPAPPGCHARHELRYPTSGSTTAPRSRSSASGSSRWSRPGPRRS